MISAQTKEAFETFLQEITFSYQRALTAYTLAIAEIDVAVSTAITSATYGYHRPTLLPFQGSAIFEATALRHPLIERHEEFGVYIPNDFALGPNYSKTEQLTHQITTNDPRGALLFGINSSGKSSLMKSVGIAIVLAQAGHFVPAKTLNMTVMHELFTRIVSTDALERGLSSFAVEMTELKHIFYRATPKSMILGDELSHGTETRSAIAIVSAALEQFVSTGALFVCTTHLHELIELDLISTQHIAPLHLAVHYDEQLDAVVFDRTLRPGNGDTLYGLEFASSLRMNSTFLKRAMDIRKQLAQDYSPAELLIKQKKSTYNAQVLVSVCSVCNAPAKDVHHIIPQEEADTNGKADHIRIHHKKNLVPLCKQCHDNIHHGKLIINGYKSTSKGLQLDIVYPQKNA
jgi:DNA mismatch repair protein MutS